WYDPSTAESHSHEQPLRPGLARGRRGPRDPRRAPLHLPSLRRADAHDVGGVPPGLWLRARDVAVVSLRSGRGLRGPGTHAVLRLSPLPARVRALPTCALLADAVGLGLDGTAWGGADLVRVP